MVDIISRSTRVSIVALSLIFTLISYPAAAQDPNVVALGLVRDSMDAYSNLDMKKAQKAIGKAMDMASQIDTSTLARVHVSAGVLWSGGFADNARGQEHFLIAVCLDSGITVDPMFSTPEVDMLFTMASKQAKPDNCAQALASVVVSGREEAPAIAPPTTELGMGTGVSLSAMQMVPECGIHNPIQVQKRKYELPFFIEVSANLRSQLNSLIVRYSYDTSPQYKELMLDPKVTGFGAMLTCNEGQVRVYDPSIVSYYIEGFDISGQLICSQGNAETPYQIEMSDTEPPIEGFAGMVPQECVPCPPWDESCAAKSSFLPGLGDTCLPDVGCAEGLRCGDFGLCGSSQGGSGRGAGTPKILRERFIRCGCGLRVQEDQYSTDHRESGSKPQLGGGSALSGENRGRSEKRSGHGVRWDSGASGPGDFVTPKLSLELSTRLDVYITADKKPQTCWEAVQSVGGDETTVEGWSCSVDPYKDGENVDPNDMETIREIAKAASSLDSNTGDPVTIEKFQYAWMINFRLRYRLLTKGIFGLSMFGGVGYGHFQYRVPPKDKSGTVYFPMPGMIDLELGLAFGFYFTRNVGLFLEIPIDFIVGDGFAANLDATLGLGFGF